MKLFLISQQEKDGYDTYDSAVVCAPDESAARNMSPDSGEPFNWNDPYSIWCSSPDKVEVTYLGEAVDGSIQGVVCASFNAG